MLRLSITIMAVLFTISVYSQTPTEQIDNWNKLDQTQQDKATELLASISTEEANVLDEFKIPVNMTYYSTNLNKKYQGKYSNNKTDSVIVGYVPLQFVNSYETELQKSYDDRGALKSVPRLEVILAIHYTESNYIPSAIAGTKTNPSFGMLQLTLSTAKDLYRTDKETYDDFFSISDGKVVFPSTEKQEIYPHQRNQRDNKLQRQRRRCKKLCSGGSVQGKIIQENEKPGSGHQQSDIYNGI